MNMVYFLKLPLMAFSIAILASTNNYSQETKTTHELVEYKDGKYADFLSSYNVPIDQLPWGKEIKGVKIALLLPPCPSTEGNKRQKLKLVVSISNQTGSSITIPINAGFPDLVFYSLDSQNILGFLDQGAVSFSDSVKLASGQMISFRRDFSFDNIDKDHVPLGAYINIKTSIDSFKVGSAVIQIKEFK